MRLQTGGNYPALVNELSVQEKGGLFLSEYWASLVGPWHCQPRPYSRESSYLVDPASSHMLVSKIKPCMSKYKQVCTVKLRMAH